jgi:SAM-dependent methyltransferase
MTKTAIIQPNGSVKWVNYQDLPGVSGERKLSDRQRLIPEDFKDASVLDIGCWGGQMMLEAKRLGAKEVVGIEIDKDAVKLGRTFGLKIIRDDLENPFFWRNVKRFDVVLCLAILGNMKNQVAVLSNVSQITDILYVEGHGSQHKFTKENWMDLFLRYTNFKTIEYLGAVVTRPFFRLSRKEKTLEYIKNKNYKRIAVIGKPGAGKTYLTKFFKEYKIFTDVESGISGEKIIVDSHGALRLAKYDCVINVVSDRDTRLKRVAARSNTMVDDKNVIDFIDTGSPHYYSGTYDYYTITN